MSEHDLINLASEGGQIDLTVHQLVIFRTVAHHLSYTRAATTLYLSQPAVSQQIRALEKIVGMRLFARKGRGIILTPAGEEMQRRAEQLLALLARTAPVVREIHALDRGSVVVGASTSAGTYLVPALLGAFHADHPHLSVALVVANRLSIEEQLLARQVDLAVISLIEHPDHFVVEPFMPYELVIVAPTSHQLARHKSLPLQSLRGETFLLREQGAGTRMDTEWHFAHAGIPLQASQELASIEAIKEGVIAELGIAVLSYESVALEVTHGDLVVLDVQGFPLQRQWHLVHLKGRELSLPAAALREFLRENNT